VDDRRRQRPTAEIERRSPSRLIRPADLAYFSGV
jgi:hypothetical protein